MARSLATRLAPGGTAILAGLLDAQARMVLAAHRRQGLVLEDGCARATGRRWCCASRPHQAMLIRDSNAADLPRILAITNREILTGTALWTIVPATLASRGAWMEERQAAGYPVLVVVDERDCRRLRLLRRVPSA